MRETEEEKLYIQKKILLKLKKIAYKFKKCYL